MRGKKVCKAQGIRFIPVESKFLNVVQKNLLITDDSLDDLYGGSHAWFDELSCKSLLMRLESFFL